MSKNSKQGYYFIVTGEKYRHEVKESFFQLKKLTSLPICIASDKKIDLPYDLFFKIPSPSYSYFDKVNNLLNTPFDKTIFLDSDISHFHSLDEIFEVLDNVDLMASLEASLGLGAKSQEALIPNSFPELSSGMLGYSMNSNFRAMMEIWKKEYLKLLKNCNIAEDQPSMRIALYQSRIKFSVLPPEYHYIPANFTRVVGSKIYSVHNHSFERAKKIGIDLNNRKIGDYAAYVDGLDVFRNPYAMEFKEAFSFIIKANKLFSFLIIRSVYIACKNFIKRY